MPLCGFFSPSALSLFCCSVASRRRACSFLRSLPAATGVCFFGEQSSVSRDCAESLCFLNCCLGAPCHIQEWLQRGNGFLYMDAQQWSDCQRNLFIFITIICWDVSSELILFLFAAAGRIVCQKQNPDWMPDYRESQLFLRFLVCPEQRHFSHSIR